MCNQVEFFFFGYLDPPWRKSIFSKKVKVRGGRGSKNQFFQNLRSKTWFDQNGPSSKKFANFMLNNFPKLFFETPRTFRENPLLVALPLPALPFTFDEKVDFGPPNEKNFQIFFFLRYSFLLKFCVSKYQKNRPRNEKVRAKTKWIIILIIIILIRLNLHTYFFSVHYNTTYCSNSHRRWQLL